jgi:small-conductance mechanosensitive channel
MMNRNQRFKPGLWFGVWAVVAGALFGADALVPGLGQLSSGLTALRLAGILAAIFAGAEFFAFVTKGVFALQHKPPVEGAMLSRIYVLVAGLAAILTVLYGFSTLSVIGTAFAAFGGMLLGWSLQAPVSGFAAWLLVSLMRPFRPGDRVQFPGLNLTGDVQEMGPMYTVLDQVGGSVGSEEAVGRYILVPNAMLFGQVVINYTVKQDAPYILDEVVVRITYDSDWEIAERILLDAANEVTGDIIEVTKQKPYIRSDIWDYGVLMRLRYQTKVQDRPEIAYRITRKIFETIQKTTCVDVAIPFIYSNRAGMDRKESDEKRSTAPKITEVPLEQIEPPSLELDPADVDAVAKSISARGLLQPIVVIRKAEGGLHEVIAGHLRFAACLKLNWKTVPAIVKELPSLKS